MSYGCCRGDPCSWTSKTWWPLGRGGSCAAVLLLPVHVIAANLIDDLPQGYCLRCSIICERLFSWPFWVALFYSQKGMASLLSDRIALGGVKHFSREREAAMCLLTSNNALTKFNSKCDDGLARYIWVFTTQRTRSGFCQAARETLPLSHKPQKGPPCILSFSEESLAAAGSSLSPRLGQ